MTSRADSFGVQTVGEYLAGPPLGAQDGARALLYGAEAIKLLEHLAMHPQPLLWIGNKTTHGYALFEALRNDGAMRQDPGVDEPGLYDRSAADNASRDHYKGWLRGVCFGGRRRMRDRLALVGFLQREVAIWGDPTFNTHHWYGPRSVGLGQGDYESLFQDTWEGDPWAEITDAAVRRGLVKDRRRREVARLLNKVVFKHLWIAQSTALTQADHGRLYFVGPTRNFVLGRDSSVLAEAPKQEFAYAEFVDRRGLPSLGWLLFNAAGSRQELLELLIAVGSGASHVNSRPVRRVMSKIQLLREAVGWQAKIGRDMAADARVSAIDDGLRRQVGRDLARFRDWGGAPPIMRQVLKIAGPTSLVQVVGNLAAGESLASLELGPEVMKLAVGILFGILITQRRSGRKAGDVDRLRAPILSSQYLPVRTFWRHTMRHAIQLSRTPAVP